MSLDSVQATRQASLQPSDIKRHPRWGTWIGWLVVAVLAVALGRRLATNENLQWDVVGEYLTSSVILGGVGLTILLTVISQVVAIVIGFVVAYAGEIGGPVLKTLGAGFIWFFRATPLLVQLLLWYNLALVFPNIGLPLGFLGLDVSWPANQLISGFTAAILGLGLHEAAYMAEIIRGGIVSIPKGQTEAAQSLGLRRGQALSRIVIPQTLRSIIPPTGNQFIGLLKASSLVSVIGGGELLTRAQYIYGVNFAVMPLLLVATIWYLVLVSLASVGQYYLERWLDVDRDKGSTGKSILSRVNPVPDGMLRRRAR